MLTVDQTSLSFTEAGGSSSITLTANKPWSASSNQSWCKVSPSGGEEATGSRISITCDANTTYDARNATVTITCAELTKQISITQATNNGLLVSQTSYELTKAAQQLNIQLQANVKFSVEVDNGCKDWIKYNSIKGLSTSTVVLDIAENKSYDAREGKVTIKQEGGNLSSTITIKQSQLDGLFITTPEYNLSNEKHTLTVEVSTNVEFDVKPEADWVKYVQTKGLNSKQIVLQVEENDTYDQRETKVNVKQKNGGLSGVITIRQDEKYGILVTQPEYNLNKEASVIEVEVKYNVDFEMVIPDECKDWIKQVSTKSLDSKTYTFSVAKNETYDNREGSITFKQKKGAISTTVTIKQAQTDGLIAEKTEYTVSSEEQRLDIKVKSNINYEVVIDDACKDWISRIQTKGLLEETLSFQVAKNEGETRLGKVVLKGEGIQETVTIKQEAEGFVEFEDANFKAYCVKNFDKNGDGEISYSEAIKISNIYIETGNIESLQGIEFMPNLTRLSCSGRGVEGGGKLAKLNVSKNVALEYLCCSINQITELDVSNNPELTQLLCESNILTALDLCKNSLLSSLNCSYNPLESINVSNNKQLYNLDCGYCRLSKLDVKNNPELLVLNCCYNQLTSIDISNNPKLVELECFRNQLSELNVTHNTQLSTLSCTYNKLAELNVCNNPVLKKLECGGNELTVLDVTKNKNIEWLGCGGNQIMSLDVTNNILLERLVCSNNQLTSLDVSNNTELQHLSCDRNQLTELDICNNTLLQYLNCDDNMITNLDFSRNTLLTWVCCSGNKLSTLDVSFCHGLKQLICASNQLETLDVSNNRSLWELYCSANKYKMVLYLYPGQIISNLTCDDSVVFQEKGVPVPQGNIVFEDINFKDCCVQYCDKDGDGEISFIEALSVTELWCGNSSIRSLKGIEHFTNLNNLYCHNNLLTELDVSKLSALKTLYCCDNQLTNLDTKNNTSLLFLDCSSNRLTRLDLCMNTSMKVLICNSNQLSSLNVAECSFLTQLSCNYNNLVSLDVSTLSRLEELGCYKNAITDLSLEANTMLTILICGENQLTNLDISSNTALGQIICNNNKLTSLKVSKNTLVGRLACDNNLLSALDLSNNTSLTYLSCSNNKLHELDIGKNNKLKELDCSNNLLSNLALSSPFLINLNCGINQLTSLDVSICNYLTNLECNNNQLKELDLSTCTKLEKLACNNNKLTCIDVTKSTLLTSLTCFSNLLTDMDVTNNKALTVIGCDSNKLTQLDVTNNKMLTYLSCFSNQLTSLDVSENTTLTWLLCQDNPNLKDIWLKTGQVIANFIYDSNVATVKYK